MLDCIMLLSFPNLKCTNIILLDPQQSIMISGNAENWTECLKQQMIQSHHRAIPQSPRFW